MAADHFTAREPLPSSDALTRCEDELALARKHGTAKVCFAVKDAQIVIALARCVTLIRETVILARAGGVACEYYGIFRDGLRALRLSEK